MEANQIFNKKIQRRVLEEKQHQLLEKKEARQRHQKKDQKKA